MQDSFSYSILFQAYQTSDAFGKLIFLSLLALSILCWAVLTYKLWQLYYVKKLAIQYQKVLDKKHISLLNLRSEDLPSSRFKEVPNPFLQIYTCLKTKTAEILEKNHFFLTQAKIEKENFLSSDDLHAVTSLLRITIARQMKKLEQFLFLLPMIVSLAPFLGILGTVWGILISLTHMQNSSQNSNAGILAGLSTALATTVFGLFIAIPALVAYNYLKNTLKSLHLELNNFSTRLLLDVEIQYRKVEIK